MAKARNTLIRKDPDIHLNGKRTYVCIYICIHTYILLRLSRDAGTCRSARIDLVSPMRLHVGAVGRAGASETRDQSCEKGAGTARPLCIRRRSRARRQSRATTATLNPRAAAETRARKTQERDRFNDELEHSGLKNKNKKQENLGFAAVVRRAHSSGEG